jgi:hypothetical protein
MDVLEKQTIEQLFDRLPGLRDALVDHDGEDGKTFDVPGVGAVTAYEEEDDEGARTLLTRFRLADVRDARGKNLVFEYWPGEGVMLRGRTTGINW